MTCLRRLLRWLGRLVPAAAVTDFGRPLPNRRARRGAGPMLDRSLDRPNVRR